MSLLHHLPDSQYINFASSEHSLYRQTFLCFHRESAERKAPRNNGHGVMPNELADEETALIFITPEGPLRAWQTEPAAPR